MRVVPLAATPNQSFTLTIDEIRWVIAIKDLGGVLAFDVTRDGERLLSGTRACAGEPIIPYAYLQYGNFIFTTVNDTLPSWQSFGISQILVYLNQAETNQIPPGSLGGAFNVEYLTDDHGFYLTTDTGEILTDD